MSRSGYVDDFDDPLQLGRWRGAVQSAIRGKRGQAFLREMLAALDALPEKALVANSFIKTESGGVCALGSVGKARGIDMVAEFGVIESGDDDIDRQHVASVFGIPHSLACEIMYENDEATWNAETPEQRFARVRRWIENNLIEWAASNDRPEA